MFDLPHVLLIFLIGVVTGFFDSVVNAGGLISVPALLFLGLPPQIVIATDRFGTLGQTITAFFEFWKAKKIVWKYVVLLSIISLVASLIGANILVNIDPKIIQKIIGVLLIVLLPMIFIKPDLGVEQTKPKNKVVGLILYFFIMILGGFFGAGTGPLIFYALTYFLGFTMIEVIATGVIPWFILSVSSVIIFALHGIINYKVGIVLFVGMAIGGYVGAHMAIKKGEIWVKRLFILFVVASSIKLLFF
jgi:uncharacterized protein